MHHLSSQQHGKLLCALSSINPSSVGSGPQSPGPPAKMSSRAAWMSPSVACSALSISSSSWIPMSLSCCIWDCQRPWQNKNAFPEYLLHTTADRVQSLELEERYVFNPVCFFSSVLTTLPLRCNIFQCYFKKREIKKYRKFKMPL